MSKEIQCKCCKEYWWEMNIHSKSGLCPNCYDYFANLEAKLAEYQNDEVGNAILNAGKKIKELQQQLAEKEKQIAELEEQDEVYHNQLTIAELEKVKGFLLEKIAEKQSCFDSGNYNDFADGVKTICELMLISIDKQIKSLKGGN